MPADQTWPGFLTVVLIMETHWVQIQSDFQCRKTIAGSRRVYLCPICSIVCGREDGFQCDTRCCCTRSPKNVFNRNQRDVFDITLVSGITNLTRFISQNILLLNYILLYTYTFLRVRRAILQYTHTAKTFIFIFIFVSGRFFSRCFFLISVNAVNAWYSHGGGKNK